MELVHLDVARTFTGLGIFQKGGPYYDLLLNLLGAYCCYRPDVGYVQVRKGRKKYLRRDLRRDWGLLVCLRILDWESRGNEWI